jgi:hypothetical protein
MNLPKKIIVNLSIMVFVTMIMLLLAEGVVRFMYKDEIYMMPRYHTSATYGDFTIRKLRPNSVFWHTSIDGHWRFEINSKGFRNKQEFSYNKPNGVIRVLSLGDSHTEGFEVRQEYTFSSVIQSKLIKHGLNAEVINTGVSGFSNAEELVFLENEGIKYQPDYVVLGFYANDFEDNIKAGLFALDNDSRLVVRKKSHIPGVKIQDIIYSIPGVQWLSENSYFYSMLFNKVWVFFKFLLNRDATMELAVPEETDKPQNVENHLAYKLLERMYNFCKNKGIKFIIIDIPVPQEHGGYRSSFPAEWAGKVELISDAVVRSAILSDNGRVQIHVPHGARHISEFSHKKFGEAVANLIMGNINRAVH